MEIRLLLSATNSPGIAPDYSTHLVLLGEAAAPLAAQNTTDRDLQHAAFLSQLDELFDESIVVRFNYTNALNGLALHLTAEQARQISELPNVAMVLQDASSRLQQNTALLTGASGVWDGSALNPGTVGTRGEGVLIGIIDSGIDFDNASFAEVGPNDGYVHINPFGDGVFRGVGDPNSPNFDPSLPLNNKVVGAWDYTSDAINASDDADHGTSVAGIAVGNYVTVPVPNSGVTTEISGVAPHANIIAYDVCTTIDDCSNSAIMAAVDQAIADGVDAINLSIGGGTEDPWDGVMASALLNAHAAGIFVAVSAGNEGPDQGTLTAPADAPWVTAVASVGISDEPTNTIRVTGENVPAHIASIIATAGEDVTIAADVGPAKVIHAADVSPGDALGTLPYPTDTFAGRIAMIDRGESLFATKVQNAYNAGAIAVIVINNVAGPNVVMADVANVPIPAVLISQESGTTLRTWLRQNPNALVRLNADVIQELTVVSSFSSRGENTQADTLAPAIAAPGAATLIVAPVASDGADSWRYFSGTSAAAPHLTGAAALLIALHPEWSPAEIQSALQTTAVSRDGIVEDFSLSPTDPFAVGSGLVNVSQAAKAGFVLNETSAKFAAADPSIGGNSGELNLASFVRSEVTNATSWTRSITSTQTETVVWTPSFVSDAGLRLALGTSAITLQPGGTSSFTLSANIDSLSVDWLFGELILSPDRDLPVARLPIAVAPTATPGVTIKRSGSGTDVSESGAFDTYEISLNTKPVSPVTIRVNAPAGIDVSSDGATFVSALNLAFTSQDTQTVTVRAIDDSIAEGQRTLTISHAVAGTGPGYSAATVIADVDVSVFDNDVRQPLQAPELFLPIVADNLALPTFQWTNVAGAASYEIYVSNTTTQQNPLFRVPGLTRLEFSPPSELGFGLHRVWVRAVDGDGFPSPWSQPVTHVVGTTLLRPQLPTFNPRPTFRWTELPGVSQYEFYLRAADGTVLNPKGLTGGSYTPESDLQQGSYSWWVRPYTADGRPGGWTARAETYIGGRPTVLTPSASTASSNAAPEFSWTPVEGAETYEVFLKRTDIPQHILRTSAISATTFPPPILRPGSYVLWVRAKAQGGENGPWSSRQLFIVSAAASAVTATPLEERLISLSPSLTLTWQASDADVTFDVYLFDGRAAIQQAGLTDSSWQTPPLTAGQWQWWVRAVDSAGTAGSWSTGGTIDTSGRAIGYPPTFAGSATPTFRWTSVAGADRYVVQLNNLTTGAAQVIRENDLTTTEFTSPVNLPTGTFRFWVRAISNSNPAAGFWSIPIDFVVT